MVLFFHKIVMTELQEPVNDGINLSALLVPFPLSL